MAAVSNVQRAGMTFVQPHTWNLVTVCLLLLQQRQTITKDKIGAPNPPGSQPCQSLCRSPCFGDAYLIEVTLLSRRKEGGSRDEPFYRSRSAHLNMTSRLAPSTPGKWLRL
ncbi:hypothetical protein LY76DRAFT_588977 [Colletotrichum caudatum]|nr:hypothetical protein LY76DRAFT_588977 [Colletotrichum caudatum]